MLIQLPTKFVWVLPTVICLEEYLPLWEQLPSAHCLGKKGEIHAIFDKQSFKPLEQYDYFTDSYKHGMEHLRKLHKAIHQSILIIESRILYATIFFKTSCFIYKMLASCPNHKISDKNQYPATVSWYHHTGIRDFRLIKSRDCRGYNLSKHSKFHNSVKQLNELWWFHLTEIIWFQTEFEFLSHSFMINLMEAVQRFCATFWRYKLTLVLLWYSVS